jgi:hypothetical protein
MKPFFPAQCGMEYYPFPDCVGRNNIPACTVRERMKNIWVFMAGTVETIV